MQKEYSIKRGQSIEDFVDKDLLVQDKHCLKQYT